MAESQRFLRLLQATRAMPQSGYVLSGIKKSDISDLAQHHYLVTITGWYLAGLIKGQRGKINLERVLEICLIHDLGELFGGDIAMPYGKENPVAHKLAKAFERENQRYLTTLLNNDGHTKELFKETNELVSDEAIVAKVADYIEVTEYKRYLGRLTEGDVTMVGKRMIKMIAKLKHLRTKDFLTEFINNWAEELLLDDGTELFESAKII